MPEWSETAPWPKADCDAIDSGTTSWLMTSIALVLFMTPGLAFFYGGLVPRKSVITITMQCLISIALIAIIWMVVGFSLAFGQSAGGFIGSPRSYFMLWNLEPCTPVGFPMQHGPGNFPGLLYAGHQMTFAIICPAIITGAFADRVRFESYLMFITIWVLAVYCPFAHWVWNPSGFLEVWGVKDFAGGLVVHVSAGWAALASVFVVGSRKYGTEEEREAAHMPHNKLFVALGTGIIMFGWLGNTGGSALSADGVAVFAIINTIVSCAMSMFCWVIIEWRHLGKPTLVGACFGAIAGMVVVAPSAGFVRPWGALLIGWIASWICYSSILLCRFMKWDDALDVWAVHGMGGFVGSILVGALADEGVGGAARDGELFGKQVAATVLCATYSFVVSFAILKVVDWLTPGGIRPSASEIQRGMDLSMHNEHAYAEDAIKEYHNAQASSNSDALQSVTVAPGLFLHVDHAATGSLSQPPHWQANDDHDPHDPAPSQPPPPPPASTQAQQMVYAAQPLQYPAQMPGMPVFYPQIAGAQGRHGGPAGTHFHGELASLRATCS